LGHPKHDQLLEIPLYRERYVFIAQGVSSHASREAISWSEAGEIPLSLLTPNMQNRRIIDTAFNQTGVTPTIAVETDSILAMYSHVCHGGLASIVPHSFLILFKRQPGLVAIPLIPSLSRQIGLLTLNRDPKSPLVHAFRTLIQQIDVQATIEQLIGSIY
ncbi:MAG: LysR family transcriptional regulator substrate-binding protein, partial [Methylococcales bacterium]